jgi:hypothetical protein
VRGPRRAGLAVNSDRPQPGAGRSGAGGEELADCPVQGVAVELDEQTAQGVGVGGGHGAGKRVGGEAENPAGPRRDIADPFRDRGERAGTGQDTRRGRGDQSRQPVAATTDASRVGHQIQETGQCDRVRQRDRRGTPDETRSRNGPCLVTSVGGLAGALSKATAEDKRELYQALGLRLTYEPANTTVRVKVNLDPHPAGLKVVSGGGSDPQPHVITLGGELQLER